MIVADASPIGGVVAWLAARTRHEWFDRLTMTGHPEPVEGFRTGPHIT
jgi:hypothetical protein